MKMFQIKWMFWRLQQHQEVNKTQIYVNVSKVGFTRYIASLFMDVNEVSLRNFIVIIVGCVSYPFLMFLNDCTRNEFDFN